MIARQLFKPTASTLAHGLFVRPLHVSKVRMLQQVAQQPRRAMCGRADQPAPSVITAATMMTESERDLRDSVEAFAKEVRFLGACCSAWMRIYKTDAAKPTRSSRQRSQRWMRKPSLTRTSCQRASIKGLWCVFLFHVFTPVNADKRGIPFSLRTSKLVW
jgi:hypothetical protein